MNRFALLSSLCLVAGLPVAHASSFGPLTDGYTLTVGSTALTQDNTSYNPVTGILSFSDLTSSYTFAEVNAQPLVSALSVTRLCAAVNFGGCQSSTISISDASLLGGSLTLYSAVQASLTASARPPGVHMIWWLLVSC